MIQVSPRKLKIVCFMCNWVFCDEKELAVNHGRLIPFDVSIVRLMCLGRVDPVTVLETFEKGADGILLVGCTPPDCHFIQGNIYAEQAVELLKKLLTLTGLEPERLELCWSSPIEEVKFIQLLNDFAAKVQNLATSSLQEEKQDEVLLNILAAKNAAADFRLRALKGRQKELIENKNTYGENISREEFSALVDETVKEEFIQHRILLLTKQKPLSVRELAGITQLEPALVLRHIVNMRRKRLIALDHVEERTPLYKALEV